jgi:hypothetical protein
MNDYEAALQDSNGQAISDGEDFVTLIVGDENGARIKLRRCAGIIKRTGKRCIAPATTRSEYCRSCLQTARQGRYGGWTRNVLGKAYREAANDASLLEMTEVIALLDAIVKRTIQSVEDLDTPKFRERASGLFEEFVDHLRRNETESAAKVEMKLRHLMQNGLAEHEALKSLTAAAERLASHVEAANKITHLKSGAISAKQLTGMFAAVYQIILDTAPPDTAGIILRRLEQEILAIEAIGGSHAEAAARVPDMDPMELVAGDATRRVKHSKTGQLPMGRTVRDVGAEEADEPGEA